MKTGREERAILRGAGRAELKRRLASGHRVDASAIEGWVYRGTSLGLPRLVERLTWKTFQKAFWRDPLTGRLMGWNVRLEQDGLDAPSRPKRARDGAPVTVWFYEVLETGGGLVIDYSRGPNPPLELTRLVTDPLVSLVPGDADLLLGVSRVGPVDTPTYFMLEREHPVAGVPRALRPLALSAAERRWAERLFAALLGREAMPELEGFWAAAAKAPAPYFSAGLRAAVCALTFLPLAEPGPFFRLSGAQRLDWAERVDSDERVLVRQLVSTVKTVACLAGAA